MLVGASAEQILVRFGTAIHRNHVAFGLEGGWRGVANNVHIDLPVMIEGREAIDLLAYSVPRPAVFGGF